MENAVVSIRKKNEVGTFSTWNRQVRSLFMVPSRVKVVELSQGQNTAYLYTHLCHTFISSISTQNE